MVVRAVVFDLFHTLVDPEDFRPPGSSRVDEVARLLGLDAGHLRASWEATREARNRGERHFAELLSAHAYQSPERLAEADRLYGRHQDAALRNPRPEVERAVAALAGGSLGLGLLSNAESRDVRAWPESPLAPHFRAAHFSCHTGQLKPEPEAYRGVLTELGVGADQAAFVGDGASDELAGARAVGFALVVFMRGFVASNGLRTPEELRTREAQADLTVDRLGDLVGLFP